MAEVISDEDDPDPPASKKHDRTNNYLWTTIVSNGEPLEHLSTEEAQRFLAEEAERAYPGWSFRPEGAKVRSNSYTIRKYRCR